MRSRPNTSSGWSQVSPYLYPTSTGMAYTTSEVALMSVFLVAVTSLAVTVHRQAVTIQNLQAEADNTRRLSTQSSIGRPLRAQNLCSLLRSKCASRADFPERGRAAEWAETKLCSYVVRHCSRDASCYAVRQHTESKSYWDHQDAPEQVLRANMSAWLFAPYFGAEKRVVDVGGGAGFFLKALPHKEARNVDLNDGMRRYSSEVNGIPSVPSLLHLEDGWADVVMSNMAFEHIVDPMDTLLLMRRKMQQDGRLVILVPGPNAFGRWRYRRGDKDHHMWAWDSQLLGNLLSSAGFIVESIELIPYSHDPWLFNHAPREVWLRKVQKANKAPLLVAVSRPAACTTP